MHDIKREIMKKMVLVLCIAGNCFVVHGMQRATEAFKVTQSAGGSRFIGFLTAALGAYVFGDDIHKYVNARAELLQAQAAQIRANLPKQ